MLMGFSAFLQTVYEYADFIRESVMCIVELLVKETHLHEIEEFQRKNKQMKILIITEEESIAKGV